MSKIWCLLVGIDNYPLEPISGAIADVNSVYHHLVHERGVPPACIQVLRDEEATRESILGAFDRHLMKNPDIKRGDPILFHFSGHGTRAAMPSGHEREDIHNDVADGDGDGDIELIVPYDAVRDAEDDPDAQPPIPDYTLGALLRRLAGEKGNNITVVLDCCHSGHGTRGHTKPSKTLPKYTRRQISSHLVGTIHPDTDRHIWGEQVVRGGGTRYVIRREGMKDKEDSHVLLAACDRFEEAEGSEEGGVFTKFWLDVLRESDGLSYIDIKRRIERKLVEFYKYVQSLPEEYRPGEQHPQLEGVGCDRPVFENAGGDRRQRFAVQQTPDKTECIIFAGVLAGVNPGTIFQLQRMGENIAGEEDSTLLGTAVATEVHATQCIAKIANGVQLPEIGVRALLTQLAEPLRERKLRNLLVNAARTDGTWFRLLEGSADADLILEAHDDHVALIRKTSALEEVDNVHPMVKEHHLDYIFPSALRYIARFNFYLSLSQQTGPFARDVDVRLHYLEEEEPTYSGEEEFMKVGGEIGVENGEATVLHEDDTFYGLVLHNDGPHPLYPYVLFFDPATYAVQFFYEPSGRGNAPLQPGTKLQLGRSPECPAAMSWVLDDERYKDTGFLKVRSVFDVIRVYARQLISLCHFRSYSPESQ
jgi:hypothetical protein